MRQGSWIGLAVGVVLCHTVAHAQIPVTDGGNLTQNIIQAAQAILIAANTAKTRYFLGFMQTPHDRFGRHQWRRCAAGIPHQHFNPVHCSGHAENPKLPKY